MNTRAFLIFCSVGLVPIALGYGAKPSASLDALFGITVDTTNLTHIMRAVTGLYFGLLPVEQHRAETFPVGLRGQDTMIPI